jgi:colanic acid biosynthesis glycosyl transferase WcaI
LHIQDFEVDVAIQMGLLPGFLQRLALAMERLLLRRFDSVSTISSSMLDKLRRSKGLSDSSTSLFPNWADTDVIRPLEDRGVLRDKLANPQQFLALYSGNMGEKQGLETVLEAARELSGQQNIRFLLCGEGSALSRLKQLAADLPSIQFQPLRPAAELNDLLNAADVHVLPQKADAADLVMPSKLTSILAAGGPVIATANAGTELARVVEKAGGMVTPPGDSKALATGILQLSTDATRLRSMRESARAYALLNLGKETILRAWADQQSIALNLNTVLVGQEVPKPKNVTA